MGSERKGREGDENGGERTYVKRRERSEGKQKG